MSEPLENTLTAQKQRAVHRVRDSLCVVMWTALAYLDVDTFWEI